eukprot:SM000071S21140  [mRNA]  locus=s71:561157:563676:- [translate_table: standard]
MAAAVAATPAAASKAAPASLRDTAALSHVRQQRAVAGAAPARLRPCSKEQVRGQIQAPPKQERLRRPARPVLAEATGTITDGGTATEWVQRTIELPSFRRGCHIITSHITKSIPEITSFRVGICHIFVLHTSASLTINENASPDVPLDMAESLDRIVPEGNQYRHLDEGYDDMPAHVKASMMGSSLTIPITSGRLNMGIWQVVIRLLESVNTSTLHLLTVQHHLGLGCTEQGIWLNEHRNQGGRRSLCITIQGERRADGKATLKHRIPKHGVGSI